MTWNSASHQPSIPYNIGRAIDPREAIIPENPYETSFQFGILDPFVEADSGSSENQPAKSGIKLITSEPPLSIPKVNLAELTILKIDVVLE